MKNKTIYLTLLIIITFTFASCAGSRSYGTQRKGYGCPANASIQNQFIEKNKI